MSCAYRHRAGPGYAQGMCGEEGTWVVYFTDPVTGMWPAVRCRPHALAALSDGEPREALYRVVAIDPFTPFTPIRIPF